MLNWGRENDFPLFLLYNAFTMVEREYSEERFTRLFRVAQDDALRKFNTGEIVIGTGKISREAMIVGINPDDLTPEDKEMFLRVKQGQITTEELRSWRDVVDKATKQEAIQKGIIQESVFEQPQIHKYDSSEYKMFFVRRPRERLVDYLEWVCMTRV